MAVPDSPSLGEDTPKFTPAQVDEVLEAVGEATMVPRAALRSVEQTVATLLRETPGAIVECGVWRGGSSFAMLLAQRAAFGRVLRPVHLLDSFQGLPPAGERDGPLAREWQRATDDPGYYDNCRASVDEVRSGLERLGFSEPEYRLLPGWFEDTLPEVVGGLRPQGIALLRIDCDWYEPTKLCLGALMPLVSEGGLVIIDDYYAWDGCALATHEYLVEHGASHRIRSVPEFHGAYFFKKAHRDRLDSIAL